MNEAGRALTSNGAETGDALGRAIGRTVREARMRAGLTMSALAQRCGVSQPHLSQLENGKVSPSIATLYRLANALGLSPQELLPPEVDGPAEPSWVVRAEATKSTPISEVPGAAGAQVLIGSPDKLIQVQKVIANPGDDLGSWFVHDGEEFLYVLAGQVLIELDDGRASELSAGDSASYASTVSHRWTRVGEEQVQILVVNTTRPKAHNGR
jgi:transcriptional regulator with XRE-family HTH domain